MANNYYTRTGVLTFNGEPKVTPIIRALFAPYDLDPDERLEDERENQLAIWELPEDSDVSWSAVAEAIAEASAEIGVKLPVGADEGDVTQWLVVLSSKFGVKDGKAKQLQLMERDDFDCDAALGDLFDLAMQFHDGHNLVSAEFEGEWRCDQPRLFEFGGHGAFFGKHVEIHSSSRTAREMGRELEAAIAAENFTEAALLLAKNVKENLAGVHDAFALAQIRHHLIRAIA